VLRNALNQAVRWELVVRNAASLAYSPRVEHDEPVTWTLDEARKFLDVVRDDRLAAAFLLDAATGMRRGELLGLRWQDVDLVEGTASINGAVQRLRGQGLVRTPPKTRQGRRTVAIAPMVVEALEAHRKRQAKEREFAGTRWVQTDYVFTSAVGTPIEPRNLTRRFQRLAASAGVPVTRFHDLRHFAASAQLIDGAPINAVQQQLGHSKASTTLDIYAHINQQVQRERATRMGVLLGGQPEESQLNGPPIGSPPVIEEELNA
jgi:integrase